MFRKNSSTSSTGRGTRRAGARKCPSGAAKLELGAMNLSIKRAFPTHLDKFLYSSLYSHSNSCRLSLVSPVEIICLWLGLEPTPQARLEPAWAQTVCELSSCCKWCAKVLLVYRRWYLRHNETPVTKVLQLLQEVVYFWVHLIKV